MTSAARQREGAGGRKINLSPLFRVPFISRMRSSRCWGTLDEAPRSVHISVRDGNSVEQHVMCPHLFEIARNGKMGLRLQAKTFPKNFQEAEQK